MTEDHRGPGGSAAPKDMDICAADPCGGDLQEDLTRRRLGDLPVDQGEGMGAVEQQCLHKRFLLWRCHHIGTIFREIPLSAASWAKVSLTPLSVMMICFGSSGWQRI